MSGYFGPFRDNVMVKAGRITLLMAVSVLFVLPLLAQPWIPLGPDGGDVRSLARDPHTPQRIFLGTSAGQLYESRNDGQSWTRFARLGEGNDYVLDEIAFDPHVPGLIYVAAWSIENEGGDLFRSTDNGKTWEIIPAMHGKSIRAFELAPSDSKVLVVGALDGVFRSRDGGANWMRISPENNAEIRNIESIAIDPANPDAIYAGTWHLPWKTSDGGHTWVNVKNGVIDDSDIFSIIINPSDPNEVYASACSGIYKSESAGQQFHKAQGIPYSSRRTRVLQMLPTNHQTVFAGTTEGLWLTSDGGKSWRRTTSANIIVNDVLTDPAHPNHILLATDRSGILMSNDGGEHFEPANSGFAHRQVTTLLADRSNSLTLYAGMVNDKEFGGVFESRDGGTTWRQMSQGLNGRDVFSLQQTSTGLLLAGTNQGVYSYDPGKSGLWTPMNHIINVVETRSKSKNKRSKPIVTRKFAKGTLNSRVNDLFLMGNKWFAATSGGIYMSEDRGKSWHGGPVAAHSEFVSVHATPELAVAAARKAVLVSADGGSSWTPSNLPREITSISSVTVDDQQVIFMAAREGAYRSEDGGLSWLRLKHLPVTNLSSIYYDKEGRRLLATAYHSSYVFESADSGQHWRRVEAGFPLRQALPVHGRIIAATAFDGVVMQPESPVHLSESGVSSSEGSSNR